ncbi:hypothetical protein F0562_022518 [Nyssa sinensis]|uniref:Uncharacterized protein n=1 Tax=Nyssa sinensis TaxID=561372 RepID=A0A5J5BRU8_9ASTE|nr:hypothetical protein F0562_022518 [Nyssa sinensis]
MCIKEIIQEILKEQGRAPRNVADDESRKDSLLIELMMLLYNERPKDLQNEESCGIGKTNIAQAIFKNCFTGKVGMITPRSQLMLEKSKDKEKETKKRKYESDKGPSHTFVVFKEDREESPQEAPNRKRKNPREVVEWQLILSYRVC